ncbi:MAG: PadR family transcriptional regulator [Candidatus Binatia bacterium]|nr:PadR family transcriptional regulator [Candidatus Binatia bacterium]
MAARSNKTRLAVLGFLTWGPMSGYDIRKAISQSTRFFWSESYGQIYPVLQQLAREGLARARVARQGRRQRVVYEITPTGRAFLQSWLAEAPEEAPVRNELLLKTFFGRHGIQARLRQHVEALLHRMAAVEQELAGIRSRIEAVDHPDAPYWLLTLRFGELQLDAQLAWCREALRMLDSVVPKEANATGRRGRSSAHVPGDQSPSEPVRKIKLGGQR